MAVCKVAKNKGLAWICRSSAFFLQFFLSSKSKTTIRFASKHLLQQSKLGGFSMLRLSLESRVDVCVDTCGLSNKKVKSWILRQVVFICFYDLPASVRAGKSQHLLFLKHQSFNKLLNLPT